MDAQELLERYFQSKKLSQKIPEFIDKIKYTQNKYIWMKAALGIMTTDTEPKIAMEECSIGKYESKDLWELQKDLE